MDARTEAVVAKALAQGARKVALAVYADAASFAALGGVGPGFGHAEHTAAIESDIVALRARGIEVECRLVEEGAYRKHLAARGETDSAEARARYIGQIAPLTISLDLGRQTSSRDGGALGWAVFAGAAPKASESGELLIESPHDPR